MLLHLNHRRKSLMMGSNEFLGGLSFSLAEMMEEGTIQGWYLLLDEVKAREGHGRVLGYCPTERRRPGTAAAASSLQALTPRTVKK